jgi:hypothetical protein
MLADQPLDGGLRHRQVGFRVEIYEHHKLPRHQTGCEDFYDVLGPLFFLCEWQSILECTAIHRIEGSGYYDTSSQARKSFSMMVPEEMTCEIANVNPFSVSLILLCINGALNLARIQGEKDMPHHSD